LKTEVSDEIIVELYLNGVYNKLQQSNIQLQQKCQKLRDKTNLGNLAVQTAEMNTKTLTEPEMKTTGVQSVEIQTDTILTETKEDKIQSKTEKIQTVEPEQNLPEMNTKTGAFQ